MARELRPPEFLRKIMTSIPDKFPLEDHIDVVIDRVGEHIKSSRPVQFMNSIQERLPFIPEQKLNTPFGSIITPEFSAPKIVPEGLDSRRKEALKTAIAIDISSAVGMIPVVGDVLSDIVEDTYGAKLRDTLTPDELDLYTKYDKLGPSTLGVVRAFAMTTAGLGSSK